VGKINIMKRSICWQLQTLSLMGALTIVRNGMQASANRISAFRKLFTGFADIRYEGFPPNHVGGNSDFQT
jgi:hypothetical protein